MNHLKNIQTIIRFSPRQGAGQLKTAEWIKRQLTAANVPFTLQPFTVDIPNWTDWGLKLDGKTVDCLPAGLTSGVITDKMNIRNSLVEEEYPTAAPNLNFSPFNHEAGRPSLYLNPALAVSHKVLQQALKAKEIKGFMKVKRQSHQTANILVGNRTNPEGIVFAHMDSVETGAIDNASGVSVMLGTLVENPELLKKNLFVFSAGEEMSFDMPTYWGHDFRVFEQKLPHLFKQAKQIIACDAVGYTKTVCTSGKESEEVYLAFPIKNYQTYKNKIYLFGGDYHAILPVYHSKIDDGRLLKKAWLDEAQHLLVKRLVAL